MVSNNFGQNAIGLGHKLGHLHHCLSAMPIPTTGGGEASLTTAPSMARIQYGEATPITSMRTAIGQMATCSRKPISATAKICNHT